MRLPATNLFSELLKEAEELLKRVGLVRAKQKFSIRQNSNIGLIDFQRSTKSSSERVVFTVNIGVWSDRIARSSSTSTKSEPTTIEDCHWRERIGFLSPDRQDKWWLIESPSDMDAIHTTLLPLLENVAVPSLLRHLSDAVLRDEWLEGNAPGLTTLQRLMYLIVLLKEIGPTDRIEEVVLELRQESEGKATEATVLRHLTKLGLDDR